MAALRCYRRHFFVLATAAARQPTTIVSWLLLRSIFLLALGYLIAYWGATEVAQKRRLTLLRDVSHLSNPRFGVDHTLTSILERTLAFFEADSCILVMRVTENWTMRTVRNGEAGRSIKSERVNAGVVAPLMAFAHDQVAVYARPLWPLPRRLGEVSTADSAQEKWNTRVDQTGENVASLLEVRSFISASLPLRNGEGRIYVGSSTHGFSRSDALFLNDIVAQAFPVIENIELLDRLATEAGLQERKRIARDLHDTAIQPYIGLKHGLSAVRNKAAADNPLVEDIDKLTDMATKVIRDLRYFSGSFKNGADLSEPVLLSALRRQAAQAREFYGIDIHVNVDSDLGINDRLAAEVFQIVNEGLSNIRKHTNARRGAIKVKCAGGILNIDIDNECADQAMVEFNPRSIVERAAALGGRARVAPWQDGMTAVHVEIPI